MVKSISRDAEAVSRLSLFSPHSARTFTKKTASWMRFCEFLSESPQRKNLHDTIESVLPSPLFEER